MAKSKTALLILLLSILYLPWLGLRDFYSRGEPREALVAQSMLLSGNWLLGQGYGASVPSKPPFTHWLTALFSSPLGEVTEFSARLASSLSALVFSICFFLFLRRRFSAGQAVASIMLLNGSVEWFRSASTCRVDMTLSALLAGSLLLLFAYAERPSYPKILLASCLVALAGLTKGPVAFVLPLSIYFIFGCLEKTPLLKLLLACVGALIIPVLALTSWYGLAYLQGGEAFFYKIYQENIARFTGSMDEDAHRHGFPYLFGALALGVFPWSVALLPAILRQIKRPTFSILRERWRALDSFTRFSALACVVIFFFYCIPSSKRGVYLLPLYPFLSHLAARYILNLSKLGAQLAQTVLIAMSSLVTAALVAGMALSAQLNGSERLLAILKPDDARFVSDVLARFSSSFSSFAGIILVVVLALGGILLFRLGRVGGWSLFAAYFYALYLLLNSAILPAFANQLSAKPFAAEIVGKIEPESAVYSYGYEFYGVSFYSQKTIMRWSGQAKAGDYIFVLDDTLPKLESELAGKFSTELVATSQLHFEKAGAKALLIRVGSYSVDKN